MDIERLSKWADKLLDTGKRNNLINFKDSKLGTVEIVFPDYKTLWSKIEHAARFEVYDSVLQENEVLNEEKRENFFTKESYISKYSKNLKRNQILLWSKFGDWAQPLKNISKKQKIAIEETGVNIVYIAFGFIHYTDSENSNYEFSAPLLLSPVHIENTSPLSPYYVELVDEVIVNPTFAYKVLYEYRIKIPEYNVNDGIEKYLKDISSLFSKFQWNVTTECKIGTFSFLKMNMYEDLKENIDKIAQNRNVRILLGETIEADTNSYEELSDESKKAKEYDFTDLHNVVDADSSQEEAIKAAKQGESFVLQGPPGTGKSQTITNIIAECLSDGKKVLFVSEKLAALSVVYNKLKSVGLDEFCLEIHSHKANKKDFISELCNTMESEKKTIGQKAQLELQNKQKIEQQLNDYAVELHRHRNIINKSLYQMYEELSSCNNVERIDFVIDNISNKGEEHLTLAENLLSNYSQYIELVGKNYHENPWCGYVNIDNSYEGTIKLKEDLKEFITVIVKLKRINKKINSTYDIVPNIKCSKEKLENVFDDNIYKLDGKALHRKLATDFSYGISRLFSSTYKNIIKEIKICKKDGKSIKYEDAVRFMYFLYKYQVDMNTLKKLKIDVTCEPEYYQHRLFNR